MKEVYTCTYRGECLVIVYDNSLDLINKVYIDSGHESYRHAKSRKEELERDIEKHNVSPSVGDASYRKHQFQSDGFGGCKGCV